MILTPIRLAHYREAFYKVVASSPLQATLLITSVGEASSPLASFVGSSARKVDRYRVRALYNKRVEEIERTKYGFTDNITGVLYLSPNSLIPLLGTFRLDPLKTQVEFLTHIDNVASVSYDEDLFESCVAVVLGLRSATTGA
jgi:hypothetical protein